MKQTETDLKRTLFGKKGYLTLKGIFSWPVTQGIASYKGAPDRVMHLNGRVIYLEIKLPKGKMSDNQLDFQAQCQDDLIIYAVIKSLEDLQSLVEDGIVPSDDSDDLVECPQTQLVRGGLGAGNKSSGITRLPIGLPGETLIIGVKTPHWRTPGQKKGGLK